MHITGFCPLIVTKDPESVMKTFEALGFERRHTKTDIEGGANVNYAMKDANGNRINIASSETMERDLTGISMNVDDFQEAYDFSPRPASRSTSPSTSGRTDPARRRGPFPSPCDTSPRRGARQDEGIDPRRKQRNKALSF